MLRCIDLGLDCRMTHISPSHLTSVESSENDCSGDDIMDDQDVDTDGQIELLWLASLNSLADTGVTDRV